MEACDLRLGYFGFHAVHCTRVGKRKEKKTPVNKEPRKPFVFTQHTKTYFSVFHQDFINFSARILHQLVIGVEDNQGYLTVAKHTQFIRLLH